MTRPPEEMKTSAKAGSLIEDCNLKTAILRMASSSLERRERRAGISAWSIFEGCTDEKELTSFASFNV